MSYTNSKLISIMVMISLGSESDLVFRIKFFTCTKFYKLISLGLTVNISYTAESLYSSMFREEDFGQLVQQMQRCLKTVPNRRNL